MILKLLMDFGLLEKPVSYIDLDKVQLVVVELDKLTINGQIYQKGCTINFDVIKAKIENYFEDKLKVENPVIEGLAESINKALKEMNPELEVKRESKGKKTYKTR